MAKAILLCGMICSGKSAYAARLCIGSAAVALSVDEIMLPLFGQDAGERHDAYASAVETYLLGKSVELIRAGVDVVMDIGLWREADRCKFRDYYRLNGIACEIHYMDISKEERQRRIKERNRRVREQGLLAYYVDEGLAEKCERLFEVPERTEVDVWIQE